MSDRSRSPRREPMADAARDSETTELPSDHEPMPDTEEPLPATQEPLEAVDTELPDGSDSSPGSPGIDPEASDISTEDTMDTVRAFSLMEQFERIRIILSSALVKTEAWSHIATFRSAVERCLIVVTTAISEAQHAFETQSSVVPKEALQELRGIEDEAQELITVFYTLVDNDLLNNSSRSSSSTAAIIVPDCTDDIE